MIPTGRHVGIALMIVVFVFGGCGSGKHYRQGEKAEKRGDVQTAYDQYCLAAWRRPNSRMLADSIKRVAPTAATYWYCRAKIAETQRHLEDALRMATRCLEIQPSHRAALDLIRTLNGTDASTVALVQEHRARTETLVQTKRPANEDHAVTPRQAGDRAESGLLPTKPAATAVKPPAPAGGHVVRSEKDALQSDLGAARAQAEDAISRAGDLESELSKLQGALMAAAKGKAEDVDKELEGARREAEDARREAEALQQKLEEAQKQAERAEEMQDELASSREQMSALAEEKQKREDEAKRLEQELAGARDTLEEARKKASALQEKEADARERLRAEEEHLAAANRALEEARNQAQEEQSRLSSQLDAARSERDSLKSDLGTARAQAEGATTKAGALESDLATARGERVAVAHSAQADPIPDDANIIKAGGNPARRRPSKSVNNAVESELSAEAPRHAGKDGFLVIRTLSKRDKRFKPLDRAVAGVLMELVQADEAVVDVDLYDGGQRTQEIRGLKIGRSKVFRSRCRNWYRLTIISIHPRSATVRIGIKPV